MDEFIRIDALPKTRDNHLSVSSMNNEHQRKEEEEEKKILIRISIEETFHCWWVKWAKRAFDKEKDGEKNGFQMKYIVEIEQKRWMKRKKKNLIKTSQHGQIPILINRWFISRFFYYNSKSKDSSFNSHIQRIHEFLWITMINATYVHIERTSNFQVSLSFSLSHYVSHRRSSLHSQSKWIENN